MDIVTWYTRKHFKSIKDIDTLIFRYYTEFIEFKRQYLLPDWYRFSSDAISISDRNVSHVLYVMFLDPLPIRSDIGILMHDEKQWYARSIYSKHWFHSRSSLIIKVEICLVSECLTVSHLGTETQETWKLYNLQPYFTFTIDIHQQTTRSFDTLVKVIRYDIVEH